MRQSYNNYISYFNTIGFEKLIKFFGALASYAGIQKHSFVTVFIFFVFSFGMFGQTDLVRWNNTNFSPTLVSGNVSASNIIPVGIGTLTHQSQNNNNQFFQTTASWPNPQQNGGGLDSNKYIEFTIAPSSGYQLNLTNFNFTHRSQGTVNYQIHYSKDNFVTSNTAIGDTSLGNNWTNVSANISAANPILPGQTLKIRIYVYNTWNNYEFKRVARNNKPNNHSETPRITGTVSIAVPIVQNDNGITAENIPVDIDILNNDSYSTLSAITITQQPTNGQNITVNGLNNVTYTPNTSYIGTDSFKYTITDENGTSNEATVNINVSAPTAPTAVGDVVSVPTGQTINIDVLSNDSPGSGAYDEVMIVSNPTSGIVTVNPNNTVAYTPNSGYSGADSFQYKVTNIHGLTSNTVTVAIDVLPCNCTHTISGGSITVNAGETYCLNSGTWSGGVTLNAGGTICIAQGATFNVNYTNGAINGTIINNGTINMPFYGGGPHQVEIINYGTFNPIALQDFAGSIDNKSSGTIFMASGNVNLLTGSEILNHGNMTLRNVSSTNTTITNHGNFTIEAGLTFGSAVDNNGLIDNKLGGTMSINNSSGNTSYYGLLDNSGIMAIKNLSNLSSTLNNYGQLKVYDAVNNISETTYITNDDLLEFINVSSIQFNGPMLTNNGTLTVSHSSDGNFKMNRPINQVYNNGKIEVSGQFEQNAAGSKLVNNCHIVCRKYFLGNGDTTNNGLLHATGTTSTQGIYIEGDDSKFYNSETGFVRGVNFRNSGHIKGYGSFYFTGNTNNNSAGSFIGDSASQQILFYDTTQTGSNIFDAPGATTSNVLRPSSMTPVDASTYNCTAPPSSAGSPPNTEEVEFLYCEPQTVNFDLDDYATPAPAVGGDPFVLLYSSIKLFEFNNSSNPTNNSTNLVISGKGTFTANTSTGEIQFIPNAGFTSGVVEAEYRISNKRSGDPITYPSPKTKITITFISINPPAITIESGSNPVCIDDTVTLSNEIEGGVWETSNNAIATVDANGVVTGVAAGTVTISYTVTEETCEETEEQEISVEACASGFMITNPMTRQRIKSN